MFPTDGSGSSFGACSAMIRIVFERKSFSSYALGEEAN